MDKKLLEMKMKKFLFIFICFSAIIFLSFRYSARVYIYYLRIYYNKFYTEEELVNKSSKMYEEKKYNDLEDFLNPLLIIYPVNDEFKKIAAFNYLKLGNALQSAQYFSDISVNSIEDGKALEEIFKSLYDNGNYSDLLYFYDKKIMRDNVNTAFYYGVSLYKKGRYDESYNSLMYVKNNTFMLPELSFYLGLNLDKKGNVNESLNYIKNAYESDRFNQAYKKTLIDFYRKSGYFKEAEILLRSR